MNILCTPILLFLLLNYRINDSILILGKTGSENNSLAKVYPDTPSRTTPKQEKQEAPATTKMKHRLCYYVTNRLGA